MKSEQLLMEWEMKQMWGKFKKVFVSRAAYVCVCPCNSWEEKEV